MSCTVKKMRYDKFFARRQQASWKAIERADKSDGRGDWYRDPKPGEIRFNDKRVYCANCGKLKGSKIKNSYYPERPCNRCGSIKTLLKDFDGNVIRFEKWQQSFHDSIDPWAELGETEPYTL